MKPNSKHDGVLRWCLILLGMVLGFVAYDELRPAERRETNSSVADEWKCTAFVIKEEQKECVRYEKRDYE